MPLSKYGTFLNSAMLKKGQLQVQSEGAKQDSSSSGLGGRGLTTLEFFFLFGDGGNYQGLAFEASRAEVKNRDFALETLDFLTFL